MLAVDQLFSINLLLRAVVRCIENKIKKHIFSYGDFMFLGYSFYYDSAFRWTYLTIYKLNIAKNRYASSNHHFDEIEKKTHSKNVDIRVWLLNITFTKDILVLQC